MSAEDGMEICPLCDTDHDGYPPDTAGAALRCGRVLAAALGDAEWTAQIDRVEATIRGQQEAVVADILTWRDEDR